MTRAPRGSARGKTPPRGAGPLPVTVVGNRVLVSDVPEGFQDAWVNAVGDRVQRPVGKNGVEATNVRGAEGLFAYVVVVVRRPAEEVAGRRMRGRVGRGVYVGVAHCVFVEPGGVALVVVLRVLAPVG